MAKRKAACLGEDELSKLVNSDFLDTDDDSDISHIDDPDYFPTVGSHRTSGKITAIGQEPRAFWLHERGTNIRLLEHLYCNLSYSDMKVCRKPSAAYGHWCPQKGTSKTG